MAVSVYYKVQKRVLSAAVTQQVIEHVLGVLKKKNVDVSVQYIADQRMRTLNRMYRGKDSTTDVLSFGTDDIGSQDAGDLFISIPQIIRQAREHHVTAKEECVRMLVHGTLHLFGYDHITDTQAKEMFGIQEKAVSVIAKKFL